MDIDVLSTGRFRPNNINGSFKNIVLLKVVLADDGKFLPHPNIAIKDQIFGEVFQHPAAIFRIIREANSFFPTVFDALFEVG